MTSFRSTCVMLDPSQLSKPYSVDTQTDRHMYFYYIQQYFICERCNKCFCLINTFCVISQSVGHRQTLPVQTNISRICQEEFQSSPQMFEWGIKVCLSQTLQLIAKKTIVQKSLIALDPRWIKNSHYPGKTIYEQFPGRFYKAFTAVGRNKLDRLSLDGHPTIGYQHILWQRYVLTLNNTNSCFFRQG